MLAVNVIFRPITDIYLCSLQMMVTLHLQSIFQCIRRPCEKVDRAIDPVTQRWRTANTRNDYQKINVCVVPAYDDSLSTGVRMKLRVKISGQKTRVDVGQDCHTLGTLRTLLAPVLGEQYGLGDDMPFEISLNGRDALLGDDKPLSDLGIVSGDLIHILLASVDQPSTNHNTQQQGQHPSSPEHPQPSTNHRAQPQGQDHSSSEQACGLRKETDNTKQTEHAASCGNDTKLATSKSDTTKADPDKALSKNPVNKDEKETVVVDTEESAVNDGDGQDKEVLMDVEEEEAVSLSMEGAGVGGIPSEPMLCREATVDSVPLVLQQVYRANDVKSRHDALCMVLHVLMMESGFSAKEPSSPEDQESINGFTLPNGWKSPGMYKMTYRHMACEGSSCGLTMVPMGSLLMVHGVVTGSNPSMHHQVQLKTDSFTFHNVQDPDRVYKNLPQLSKVFKDSVAQPLLADMRQVLGLPALHGLLALSAEIQLMVLQHLDVLSLVRLSAVCKDLHSVANDQSLWRFRYLRDFGDIKNKTSTLDWKELYKKHYQDRKKAREWMRHQRSFHPPPPPWAIPTPPHSFPPTYPPGFIGGDYDRYPPGMPGAFFPPGMGRGFGPSQPIRPSPLGPRFDPIGPLPEHQVIPGRGMRDGRGRMGPSPSFGFMPKFF
ncbi:F-box only protein 7-like [Branchiostoma floridae]|uniref:F-box only protein 7-like n=1 Tax=Branchiostoma floridae TaxID=7739 RepID=A0A9J7KSQ5_BRAFL|nr:F-box only protein 7-like [Branchiostoma floridae]